MSVTATAPRITNGQSNDLNTFSIGVVILFILAGGFVYAFLLRKK
ncbi:hypothetical protein [Methanocella conradii]|nr:hypothetical protein [Methanocella conradii]